MKAKLIIFLSVLFIFTTVSCGKKEDNSGVTTIEFWNFPNFTISETFDDELIKAFEEKNPNIKVVLQKINFTDGPAQINSAIVSKTAPDVIYDAPGRIMDWADQGVLAPLNSIMGKDVTGKMAKQMIDPITKDGNYYMYPIHTTPFMMAFNKSMLEKAGILNMLPLDRADRAWNMQEYEAMLTAIKDKMPGVKPTTIFAKSQAGDQGTRAYIANMYNSAIINKELTEYTINNEAGVKALEWVVGAIGKGLIAKGGESLVAADSIDMYVQGLAASSILYAPVNWIQNQPRAKDNFETVFIPYPNDAGKPQLEILLAGPCVFDNGDPKKVEAAKKFVAFMGQDSDWAKKVVTATGCFSTRDDLKNLYGDSPEHKYLESMTKAEYIATYYNHVKGFVEMRTYWFASLQQAITGQSTSKKAFDTFVERANATLK